MAELPRRALAAERAQGRRRQGQRAVRRALPPAPDARRAGLRRHAAAAVAGRHQRGRRRSSGSSSRCRSAAAITVEGQVTGEETHGGLQLVCFEPKPGRFPEQPPFVARTRVRRGRPPARPRRGGARRWAWRPAGACASSSIPTRTASTRGIRTTTGACSCTSSTAEHWTRITGEPLPSTPVDVRSYIAAGLPWFDLYDDHLGDIEPSETLAKVTSVGEPSVADGIW